MEIVSSTRFAHLSRHLIQMLPPFEICAMILRRHFELVPSDNTLLVKGIVFGCEPDAFFTTWSGVSHRQLFHRANISLQRGMGQSYTPERLLSPLILLRLARSRSRGTTTCFRDSQTRPKEPWAGSNGASSHRRST